MMRYQVDIAAWYVPIYDWLSSGTAWEERGKRLVLQRLKPLFSRQRWARGKKFILIPGGTHKKDICRTPDGKDRWYNTRRTSSCSVQLNHSFMLQWLCYTSTSPRIELLTDSIRPRHAYRSDHFARILSNQRTSPVGNGRCVTLFRHWPYNAWAYLGNSRFDQTWPKENSHVSQWVAQLHDVG